MAKHIDSARALVNTVSELLQDPYSHSAEHLQSVAQAAHDDINAAGGDYAGAIASAYVKAARDRA